MTSTKSRADVPKYNETVFAPKRHKYCVCVFVINEGQRIRSQVAAMEPLADQIDIVIADGNSTDGSLEPEYLKDKSVRALLIKTDEGRLSAQMRMALAWSLKQGYEGVVVVDGNGKDGVEALPLFIEALESGFDHVQGSRYVPGGQAVNTPWLRHWGVRLLHAPLISLAAGTRYTDTTNGFRAYSRALLTDDRVAPFRKIFSNYELHYYLAIRAPRLGYRTTEVPVSRKYPSVGKTPTKISGWRGNQLILKTLLKACLGQYNL